MKSLVTGVSLGGIGEAVCHRLITAIPEQMWITISATGKSETNQIADKLKSLGAKVQVVTGDLTDRDFPKILVDRAVEFGDGLDLVVSGAGKAQRGKLLDMTDAKWDYSFDLHVRAAWHLAQSAYHHLLESRNGSFIAIGSIAGTMPNPNRGVYPVAKAALIMLCQNLAQEWVPDVRVNVVSPGLISTRRSPKPHGYTGIPHDVAEAVLFLLRNPYMTGHNLVIDGGLTGSGLSRI